MEKQKIDKASKKGKRGNVTDTKRQSKSEGSEGISRDYPGPTQGHWCGNMHVS